MVRFPVELIQWWRCGVSNPSPEQCPRKALLPVDPSHPHLLYLIRFGCAVTPKGRLGAADLHCTPRLIPRFLLPHSTLVAPPVLRSLPTYKGFSLTSLLYGLGRTLEPTHYKMAASKPTSPNLILVYWASFSSPLLQLRMWLDFL